MMTDRATLESMEFHFGQAVCPEDIFGQPNGQPAADLISRTFRAFTRACHPDKAAAADKELAGRIFANLTIWRERAEFKLAAGTYGQRAASFEATATADYTPVELMVRGKQLTLQRLFRTGLFSTIHEGTLAGRADRVLVKVANEPADNSLLEHEFNVLTALQQPDPTPERERFFTAQRRYVPEPLGSFLLQAADGSKRRANILWTLPTRALTIAELRSGAFPRGLHLDHMAWILRRLLLTLWMGHLKGYAHGAVTPDHVLIYPREHGLVLLDWTCSAGLGAGHIPAINPVYRDFYPPEVLAKRPASVAIDLFMAAKTALYLLGESAAPQPVLDQLGRCLQADPARRPQDAELFHNELGDTLKKTLGPPRFAELVVP